MTTVLQNHLQICKLSYATHLCSNLLLTNVKAEQSMSIQKQGVIGMLIIYILGRQAILEVFNFVNDKHVGEGDLKGEINHENADAKKKIRKFIK